MSAEITLHGRSINSIFELLGLKENDITYSLGWAFSQCVSFREMFLRTLFRGTRSTKVENVLLQEYEAGSGITDIELRGPDTHVIIEAKRGWVLPSVSQLKQYSLRLRSPVSRRMLVTMSECSADYARLHLPAKVGGIAVRHLGWNDVRRLADRSDGTHAEKRLLKQFRTYLERIVKMQEQDSNWVYVVSLGRDTPEWSALSWRDIVTTKRRYFHPFGSRRWPKEPPNYMAFRYEGRLQSIHHVDDCKIVTDMHAEIPEIDPEPWEPHFLYALGAPIHPPKVVKTGKIYPSGRVWAMIDLLLTCDTIAEARDRSQERQAREQ